MSIDHSLEVAIDLAPRDLLVLFWDCLGLGIPEICYLGDNHVPCAEYRDFHGYAGPTGEPGRSWYKEDFGVAPTVNILFNVPYEGSLTGAQETLVRGTVALIRRIPDDLFLMWDGGDMFLIRRQGKLYVNPKAHPPLKALVDLPYEEIEMIGS